MTILVIWSVTRLPRLRSPSKMVKWGFSCFLVAVVDCQWLGVGICFLGATSGCSAIQNPSEGSRGLRVGLTLVALCTSTTAFPSKMVKWGFSCFLVAVVDCQWLGVGICFLGATSGCSAIQNPSEGSRGLRVGLTLVALCTSTTAFPSKMVKWGFSCFLVAVVDCQWLGVGICFLGATIECSAFQNPSEGSRGLRVGFYPDGSGLD